MKLPSLDNYVPQSARNTEVRHNANGGISTRINNQKIENVRKEQKYKKNGKYKLYYLATFNYAFRFVFILSGSK